MTTTFESMLDVAEQIVKERLARLTVTEKDSRAYPQQRKSYNVNIFGAMNGYLTGGDNLIAARNEFSREMNERFYSVFVMGYTQAGGSEKDLRGDSADLDWINARTEEEIGYIKSLFVTLKGAKQSDLTRDELVQLAHDHADAYTNSLDMVYSEGKMRGSKNIMLTMVGEDGAESCTDCVKRKGKRYSVKKWLAIGYPPSRDFECHGYNCQHYLATDDGNGDETGAATKSRPVAEARHRRRDSLRCDSRDLMALLPEIFLICFATLVLPADGAQIDTAHLTAFH